MSKFSQGNNDDEENRLEVAKERSRENLSFLNTLVLVVGFTFTAYSQIPSDYLKDIWRLLVFVFLITVVVIHSWHSLYNPKVKESSSDSDILFIQILKSIFLSFPNALFLIYALASILFSYILIVTFSDLWFDIFPIDSLIPIALLITFLLVTPLVNLFGLQDRPELTCAIMLMVSVVLLAMLAYGIFAIGNNSELTVNATTNATSCSINLIENTSDVLLNNQTNVKNHTWNFTDRVREIFYFIPINVLVTRK